MKKTLFGKKRAEQPEELSLNITAMADIFVILLVFLLKSYSASAVNIAPTAGLVLPTADADKPPEDALRVEIAQNAILLEGAPVMTLTDYQFKKAELTGAGVLAPLSAALDKERSRQVAIAKQNSDVKIDAKITVISDQNVPYSTLKAVLASAAVKGYTDFKMVVARGE